MPGLTPSHRTGIATGLALLALFIGAPAAQTIPTAAPLTDQSISPETSIFGLSDWQRQSHLDPQILAQQQQPRTALVIGNADYGEDDRLEGPDNDARAMYERLLALGFDVPPPLINANKQQMEQALRNFSTRMRPGGVNVFYYSGHGVQIEGENYLLPVGLDEFSSEAQVKYNAVPLGYVVAEMFSVVHDFNFLIIDACRNNPFYSRWGRPKGPGNEGLASTRPPRGTVIAYATQENEVAIDGGVEEYSPFTASLLNYLEVPDLNVFEMLTRVATDVEAQTNGDQIPSWEGNPREIIALNPSPSLIFIPITPPNPVPQPVRPTPPAEPTLISAATGVNYQPLQEALAAGDFKLADQTTSNLMARAADREAEGWLRTEDVQNFSCEDLNIIDQLWLSNSDGKFGFSVQQQIYQSLGGILGVYNQNLWDSLGNEVGWRRNEQWLPYNDLDFGLNAPSGHLPWGVSGGLRWAHLALSGGVGAESGWFPDPGSSFLWKSVDCST